MINIGALAAQLNSLWHQATAVWVAGGWCMGPMAVNSLVLFGLTLHLYLKLREKGFGSVPEKTWRRWIEHPTERKGPVGDLLDFVTGSSAPPKQTALLFEEVRATEIAPFERDLWLMRVCVSAPPLIGLLGTVTGILTLFGALAHGTGGEETTGLVAGGVSEAMIATETGLVIAIPGLLLHYCLSRKYERYHTSLAHLETVCTQELHKRLRREESVSCALPQTIRELNPPSTGTDMTPAAQSASPAHAVILGMPDGHRPSSART